MNCNSLFSNRLFGPSFLFWGEGRLGDHLKAAIYYHFKTGHREAA
jgi:hypothetical protein